MKILIDSKKRRYFWNSGDIHTDEGTIKEEEIKNASSVVKTNKGAELLIFDASSSDIIANFKSETAAVNPKDAGAILAHTGINSKSKVVDAGSGSGFLAAYLSNVTDNITTYEKNKVHYEIARKNLKKINPNVEIKNKDISLGIDETDVDLITLDLPTPWEILSHVEKALKSGGFLVCYLPNMNQVQELIETSKNYHLILEKVLESIEREWTIHGQICRPKHEMLGHTAFLVFFRKY